MFIHNGKAGEQLNDEYFGAVRAQKINWMVPESKHTGASTARPREYERRVVGFFNRTLLGRGPSWSSFGRRESTQPPTFGRSSRPSGATKLSSKRTMPL